VPATGSGCTSFPMTARLGVDSLWTPSVCSSLKGDTQGWPEAGSAMVYVNRNGAAMVLPPIWFTPLLGSQLLFTSYIDVHTRLPFGTLPR
jgi:hypothetical protein